MNSKIKKTKVVFLGSRPLGHFALSKLMEMESVEVVGCIVRKPSENAWWTDDPYYLAKENKNEISYDDLHSIDFDFGVSINYWKIIESYLINKPSLGFVNIHHAYMLSLRGRDMTTHAILNARKNNIWYHGTTLHYTDDGLDTGPIIATESCEISEYDTSWSLFNKVDEIAKNMLNTWIPRLLISHPPVSTPERFHPMNLRADQTFKNIVNIYDDPLRSYDIVRAYDFNGHYEPASTIINGNLVYLSIHKTNENHLLLEIDAARKIFGLNATKI